jgi:hypothetical protein
MVILAAIDLSHDGRSWSFHYSTRGVPPRFTPAAGKLILPALSQQERPASAGHVWRAEARRSCGLLKPAAPADC